jgi:hypothetical protein
VAATAAAAGGGVGVAFGSGDGVAVAAGVFPALRSRTIGGRSAPLRQEAAASARRQGMSLCVFIAPS